MNTEAILKQMTLEEKAAFCSGRDFWKTKNIDRLGVPSVMMCDGPHGLRKQEGEGDHLGISASIETVCYPTAAALASSFDRSVMSRLGEALGKECQAENVAMLLGPGLNIKRSPLCGRNFEYFSEDPYLAGEIGAAYVQALQNEGVAACAKHFACNNQETRRMSGSSQLDERTMHEIYLPAFERVVKKGKTRGIMCAYNAINGTFCSVNRLLLNDILRDMWGYDGFVVTDWGAVKDRAQGIASGLDLEMPGGPSATGEEIVQAVKEGTLSEADLDKAVLRLLTFVNESLEKRRPDTVINRDENRALARELAAECAVLMKNDGALPIKEGAKVVFIGEFAAKPRYQGAGSSHINVKHAASAAETLPSVPYARGYDSHIGKTDAVLLDEAVQAAKNADIPVIFAGLPDAFETEGADREHMRLPDNQNELIAAVSAVNPNTVVVLHGGSPMELPWLSDVNSVLCMYLGGEQAGAAAADLLYGKVNPGGHLAETWPLRLQDNPSYLNFPGEDGVVTYAEGIFTGYRYYDKKEMPVQFPFGHGLSYTQFEYSGLSVNSESIKDTDTLTVTLTVKNTGARCGKTAVQLYVRNAEGSVRRPVRELRAFEKVALQPGESKEVSFTLDRRAFAYWEPRCRDWFVESGTFTIEVGESSRDIRCEKAVYVEGTRVLPLTVTETTTVGQLMKHPAGKAIAEKVLSSFSLANGDQTDSMGEGAEKMMKQMALEMPLGAFISFGSMTKEGLKALIDSLNR